jgi:probable F420-dependent oxidoreductase
VIPIGVHAFVTDRTVRPDELARAVEERGFESLFLPEHSHAPLLDHPDERHPGLSDTIAHMLDPLVALTLAAYATSTLRIGTGVVLAAQHDPIILAKALASLDLMSGGRTMVGVGYGWNVQEMRDHGVDPSRRWQRLADHVKAMRRLWEDEVVTVQYEEISFGPCEAWPKPAQARLPVYVGGKPNLRTFGHIVDFADGWFPRELSELQAGLPLLQSVARRAGMDPERFEVLMMTSGDANASTLGRAEEAGATRVIVRLDQDDLLSSLDEWANAAAGYVS